MSRQNELYQNPDVWAAWDEGKTLGEIAQQFKCSIYDLSPWLYSSRSRETLRKQEAGE